RSDGASANENLIGRWYIWWLKYPATSGEKMQELLLLLLWRLLFPTEQYMRQLGLGFGRA
ncbi:hypothetical protein PanWU01x14_178230, partial [Parasponia andersonii]